MCCIFVFWFSRAQENASQDAFLRFAMMHLKMPHYDLPKKCLLFSGKVGVAMASPAPRLREPC